MIALIRPRLRSATFPQGKAFVPTIILQITLLVSVKGRRLYRSIYILKLLCYNKNTLTHKINQGGLKMFGWGKQSQEQREQEEQAERVRLQSLSEKEIMAEMLIELKRIEAKLDSINRTIRIYSN